MNAFSRKKIYKIYTFKKKVLLEPLMRGMKELQVCSCKELYIVDLPLYFQDFVELVRPLSLISFYLKYF